MTVGKRLSDIFFVLLFLIPLAPVMLLVLLAVLVLDGKPVFFVSERMKTPDQGFLLWKFRTMRPDDNDSGVSGGDKTTRITKTGGFLRKYRLDELPQLWNILKGDISFVGPRPPLRRYVEKFPNLYTQVLKSRPGVTGLATLAYHKTEEELLSDCHTAAATEETYCRRCVPRKATIDLIYAKNRSFCFDLKLMTATVLRRMSLH